MKKFLACLLIFLLMIGSIGCFGEGGSRAESSAGPETSASKTESSAPGASSAPESSQPAEESSGEESEPADADKRAMMQAYLEVVHRMTAEHGAPEVRQTRDGLNKLWGVGTVRLIDFNGDGVEELYIAYTKDPDKSPYVDRQALYVYHDGQAVEVMSDLITNKGGDVSPITCIVQKDDRYYLGVGTPFYLAGYYLTVDLDAEDLVRKDLEFQTGYMSDNGKFVVNGEEVTMAQYEFYRDDFLNGAVVTEIPYYYPDTESEENLATTMSVIEDIEQQAG